jgi:hypothetical protein
MKTKPILFSTPMVQAILDGTKSQTRREIEASSSEMIAIMINVLAGCEVDKNKEYLFNHARINKDDILWVRETWQTTYNDTTNKWDYIYRTDGKLWIDDDGILKWKPSIHMPKKAARIFLKVIDVKIERLKDISTWDAWKEGVKAFNEDFTSEEGAVHGDYENYLWVDDENYEDHCFPSYSDPVESFKSLWRKINGLESWDENPLVWVIEFERIDKPKDFNL